MNQDTLSSFSPDLSTLAQKLLSNPETLAKIRGIISNPDTSDNGNDPPPNEHIVSKNEESTKENEQINANQDDSSATFEKSDTNGFLSEIPDFLSKISSLKSESSLADKQQIALLLAIRPYLSERRKELIDAFIKMNKFSAIFMSLSKEGDKNVL